MRTPHDDLRDEIFSCMIRELDPGDLDEETAKFLFLRTTSQIMGKVWEYVEDYKIDSNGNLLFDYGMLRHLLKGGMDV